MDELLKTLWNRDSFAPGYEKDHWEALEQAVRDITPSSSIEDERTMWMLFHRLWSRDVGSIGYDKEKWKTLEWKLMRKVRPAGHTRGSL